MREQGIRVLPYVNSEASNTGDANWVRTAQTDKFLQRMPMQLLRLSVRSSQTKGSLLRTELKFAWTCASLARCHEGRYLITERASQFMIA